MNTEIPNAIRFGMIAYLGVPSGKKLDHVRLPKQYTMGPMKISCPKAVFIISFPGIGRLILLKSAHFCVQNIRKNPKIANTHTIGCKDTKKQTKR